MMGFLGCNGPSPEEFHARFWRRCPLHVPGGGGAFLGLDFDARRFDDLADRLEAEYSDRVTRGGNGVVFCQHLDLVDRYLREVARHKRECLGWPAPWFDGVKTVRGSAGGIGSHFDDSDNFVIQIEGSKTWRLHSPVEIDSSVLRRRMLRDASVGPAPMPGDAVEFQLEAGDVLYIPLFWIHHGVSEGDSLSLSLVCNTTSAISSLLPVIRAALSIRPEWWEPLGRSTAALQSANGALESREQAFDRLWSSLSDPRLKDDVYHAWRASDERRFFAPSAKQRDGVVNRFRVISINPADPDVTPKLLQLQKRAYAREAELIGFAAIPPLLETEDDIRSSGLRWLCIADEDSVLGAVGFVRLHDGTIDIDRLMVDPKHFRQGLATTLVRSACDGCPATVTTGRANVPAVRLYESLGFSVAEDLEVEPGVWLRRFRHLGGPGR